MSNHRILACRSIAAVASLALSAGLSLAVGSGEAGSEVLAKIGPKTITRSEFETVFAKQYRPSSVSIDSARQRFLESLVHKELLVLESKTRGLYDSPTVKAQTDKFLRDELGSQVRAGEGAIDSTISDQELKDSYQRSLREIKMLHIIHWSEASIDSARKRIAAGEPFRKVAREVTIDRRGVESSGELPWINGLQVIEEFRPSLDPLKIGDVSKPFQSNYGWHIVQLDSVRDRAASEGFDAERDLVIRQILDDRQRRARLKAQAEYRTKYKYEIDQSATLKTMAEAKAAFEAAAADTNRAMLPFGEQWVARDSTAVLARYTGGTVTVAEYRERILEGTYINMESLWGRVAPAPALNDVRERFYEEVRLTEAKKRGLDQDPELKARVALKQEEYAVDAVYMQEIDPHLKFTDDQLKSYYDAHTESFPRQEFYRCARIVTTDAEAAKRLTGRMAGVKAEAFDSLVAEVEKSGTLVRSDRDTGRMMPGQQADPIMDAARNMAPGEVGHVVGAEGHHTVFVLIEYQPEGIESFELAKRQVQSTMYNVVAEEKLTALLKELETRYQVEVYPDRLQTG